MVWSKFILRNKQLVDNFSGTGADDILRMYLLHLYPCFVVCKILLPLILVVNFLFSFSLVPDDYQYSVLKESGEQDPWGLLVADS